KEIGAGAGASGEGERGERDGDGGPAELRVAQALGDLREIHGREQVREERDADRDAEREPEAAQLRRNRMIRGPAGPAPRRWPAEPWLVEMPTRARCRGLSDRARSA